MYIGTERRLNRETCSLFAEMTCKAYQDGEIEGVRLLRRATDYLEGQERELVAAALENRTYQTLNP
jgi:hypothetical protein